MNIKKVGVFNTWYAETPGMISWTNEEGQPMLTKETVSIHFTSDEHETLSLSIDDAQITVPFDKVMKVAEEARKHNITRN